MRGAITVVMRDLNVAILMGDIVEGVPVVYSTFVGYDEVAHHSGIEEPDAFAVLKQHDAQLARLERAVEQAPRPYHLVVLSDHGQTQGRPFRQRYELELAELVQGALRDGEVFAPAAADEGMTTVGGAITDARDEDNAGARMLARATRDQLSTARWCSGRTARPSRRRSRTPPSTRRSCSPPAASASSTLPEREHRMTAEEIDALHPGLIADARRPPRDRLRDGRAPTATAPIVLGGGGSRRLRDDAVSGEDPLRISARTPPTTCAAPTASPTARTSSSTACTTRRRTRSRRSRSSWARTAGSAAGRATRSRWCRAAWSEPAAADRRRPRDARRAPRLARRDRAGAEAARLRGSSRAAWHGAHTEPGLSQRDLEGHRRSAARFEASIA